MYASVFRALHAISPVVSRDLVPEATWVRMLAFAARIPELGQAQYIECRLGSGDRSQVDLLVSGATTYDRVALDRALRSTDREDAVLAPGLAPMRRFLDAWLDPGSVLHHRVPVFWLEFDHMEVDASPIGGVCVCLAPAYLDPFAALPDQRATTVLPVVAATIRTVMLADATDEEQQVLDRCFQRLPAGACWINLSVMAGRTPRQLKLYGVFPRDSVLDYLASIGWAGDRSAIADLLARYCPVERTADQIYLDLPVAGIWQRESAGLGVGFGQQHLRNARERDPARQQLLRQLESDGVCTERQRLDLADWPESEEPSVEVSGKLRAAGDVAVQRWLDIKLVHRARLPLSAKAYLGFFARDQRARVVTTASGERLSPAVSPAPAATCRTSRAP
jgi:hypothetical protein